ncbi:MAG: hypothetical protein GC206_07190 [Alphaproteobacteria bacterium]|nr:hypothetical protein [Alphaproteobacteria bacterium]
MGIASTFVVLAGMYLWIGVAVTVVFLGWGVDRIDPSARGAYLFRILAAPGVVGLWPLVIWRWGAAERSARRRGPRNAG